MAKMYFVRYLEPRRDLVISSSPTFVMRTSFDTVFTTSRNRGHRRKADAVAWVEKVNAAAGKVIAEYAGAFEAQNEQW